MAAGRPQVEIPWTVWEGLNSFTLLTMPLFLFMGAMFSNTGVIRSLFTAADKWLGVLPGGLASSVIGANAFFGAMCGSSIAAAAAFGVIAFPEMEKRGYDPKLAFGSIAIGGTLSQLIPPSLLLIVYGVWETQSIARLFAAAVIPGIIVALLLVIQVIIMVKLNPKRAPKSPPVSWRERLIAARDVLPWLGVIVLVLGVILGGLMTATEAAALGAFLSIIMPMAYRRFSFAALKASFLTAVKVTSMIGFVMVTAKLMAFVFQAGGLTEAFSSVMLDLPFGKYGTLIIICVVFVILGMFFDAVSMLLLTMPFVMPILYNFGFHPIWWGVVFVLLAEVGVITPPFGLNLFTIHGVVPRYSLVTIAAGSLPFLIPLFLMIGLLIIFPQLALWLPGILF